MSNASRFAFPTLTFLVGLFLGMLIPFGTPPPNQVAPPAPGRVVVDGQSIEAPAGSEIVVLDEEWTRGTVSTRTESGTARSPDIKSTSGDAVLSLDHGAPDLSLNGGIGVHGYSTSWSAELIGGAGVNIFHILGAICLLGAGVLAYLRRFRAAAICAASGVGVIIVGVFVSQYPWVLLILGLILLVALAFWVWDNWDAVTKETALGAVLAGEKALARDQRDLVKVTTKNAAERAGKVRAVEREIRRAKAKAV